MAKIISYERWVYESVDDNSQSYAMSQKPTRKKRMQQRVKLNSLSHSLISLSISKIFEKTDVYSYIHGIRYTFLINTSLINFSCLFSFKEAATGNVYAVQVLHYMAVIRQPCALPLSPLAVKKGSQLAPVLVEEDLVI